MSVELYLDLKAHENAVTLLTDPQLDKVADSIGSDLFNCPAHSGPKGKTRRRGQIGGNVTPKQQRNQSLLVLSGDMKDSIHALVTGGGFNKSWLAPQLFMQQPTNLAHLRAAFPPAHSLVYGMKTRIEHLVVYALEDLL